MFQPRHICMVVVTLKIRVTSSSSMVLAAHIQCCAESQLAQDELDRLRHGQNRLLRLSSHELGLFASKGSPSLSLGSALFGTPVSSSQSAHQAR
ncbi:hypothetical protein SODALDRAFT_82023 [Sodiomyces alkalinus F11]|uniref:Secreted protein n=1 Tax=Sodiomyces alkalinus (strain CBS 110278 / VKM F-3762 / F11) TaxID=1314773 RepID=A0A3N2PK04_SODAK|nr:hypothetical protein SODALDRAFT_82023 [Sodiomyces alkalinus F11]ROT34646.1 hypothetical protein SODALDRAFT_82023 [Sodiomyces alkalinus F11]